MTDSVKQDQDFSGTKSVDARHRFPIPRLNEWMRDNVKDYCGPLSVRQFKGGQSNPTFQLETPTRSYVLRRKPFGSLLPSAHAVDREFLVIGALHAQGFPVARVYALCMDEAVIGSAFYIMSLEKGRVFWNPKLPSVPFEERRAIFTEKIETLAKLHRFDPAMLGLGSFGRAGNYFARQVDRWTNQYRASETTHIPEMEKLIEWLAKTVPPQERVSIVHGDYRIDNMIFHTSKPVLIAVLDWELSTLGDPMADFMYLLMQWVMPGLEGADFTGLNLPTATEAAEIYCKATNRDRIPDVNWYFAFNLFRLVGILQGIAKRVEVGTASSAKAELSAARRIPLAKASWTFAQKAGAV